MAENFDLIFGQSAGSQYAWSDSDYQNGWSIVGSTPPTAEQFDALQRRNDTKAKDLNDRLSPLETKATADGRQAATEYAEGVMVTADGLPNGWLLECVVAGTTDTGALVIPSPLVIGGTIVDGTVTWKMLNLADKLSIADVPKVAGFNAKQTFTSSGTFTPTVTGVYKITLQGGGGGGGGAGYYSTRGLLSGGGGGQGATLVTYEKLIAGQSYSYTIGAGGAGGTAGSTTANGTAGTVGGNSTITIGDNVYSAGGGKGATDTSGGAGGGEGGKATINSTSIPGKGSSGSTGGAVSKNGTGAAASGAGGGNGGGAGRGASTVVNAAFGGGGAGGSLLANGTTCNDGNTGGDGFITFEWQTGSLA